MPEVTCGHLTEMATRAMATDDACGDESRAASTWSPTPSSDPASVSEAPAAPYGRDVFEHSIDIAAPPAAVFAVWADVERWPEWTRSVTGVEMVGITPLQVGSQVKVRQPRLGAATWTVTALEPDRSFTWVTGFPGLQGRATHEVTATADGCVARMSVQHSGLLAPLLRLLTAGITRRYLGYEADGLKSRVEA